LNYNLFYNCINCLNIYPNMSTNYPSIFDYV